MKKADTKKKKVKVKSRDKAKFGAVSHKSEKLSSYRYDQKPSTLMKDSVGTHESRADLELKRLMRGDVFRSNKTTVKGSNSNPRRNK